MPSKSGRIFLVGETSAPMDPSLEDIFNTLNSRIRSTDVCKSLETRLMPIVEI